MTDFYDILEPINEHEPSKSFNPFAGRIGGDIVEGAISIDYLNENFGQFESIEEMKNATESELLILYFNWLEEQGILN